MNENSSANNALKLTSFELTKSSRFMGCFWVSEQSISQLARFQGLTRYQGCLHQESTSPASEFTSWLRAELSEQGGILRSFLNFNNIQIALRVGGIHQVITRDWQDVLPLKFHEYMPVDRNLNYSMLN